MTGHGVDVVRAINDVDILRAVKDAGRFERDDWAHPTVIAMNLDVARSTAVRYCKRLVEKQLLESSIRYGWRYSKAVKSIRFKLTDAGEALR